MAEQRRRSRSRRRDAEEDSDSEEDNDSADRAGEEHVRNLLRDLTNFVDAHMDFLARSERSRNAATSSASSGLHPKASAAAPASSASHVRQSEIPIAECDDAEEDAGDEFADEFNQCDEAEQQADDPGEQAEEPDVVPVHPCPCRCARMRGPRLGPAGHTAVRCACPLCGHTYVAGGNGCHRRILLRRPPRGTQFFCWVCARYCLTILRQHGVARSGEQRRGHSQEAAEG